MFDRSPPFTVKNSKTFRQSIFERQKLTFPEYFRVPEEGGRELGGQFFVGERPKRQFIEFNVQHSGLKCFFFGSIGARHMSDSD